MASKYTWLIAMVDNKFIKNAKKDLRKFEEYVGISSYLPRVKVLKRQFKNKPEFEFVPLLFNYGFFRVPKELINIDFLDQMQKNIPCIYSWLRDEAKSKYIKPMYMYKHNKSGEIKGFRLEELNDVDSNWKKMGVKIHHQSPFASARVSEINALKEIMKRVNIYSKKDIKRLQPGTFINLKGYPFEGLDAKVLEVNTKRKKVKVQVFSDTFSKNVEVAFDNVFYSIYQGGFDDNDGLREKSLEEIKAKSKNSLDKLMFDSNYE